MVLVGAAGAACMLGSAGPSWAAPKASTGAVQERAVLRGAQAAPSTSSAPGATLGAAAVVGAAAVAVRSSAAGRRGVARIVRCASEVFQQGQMNFPAKYEEIANTNDVKERKTDIICTIGPKSWDPEVLVQLIDEGMTVIRCNMSHGDHEEQNMKLANLEKAYEMRPDLRGKVKILMDTRGPEIRTGMFEVYNSKKELKAGQDFKLLCGDYQANLKKGNETQEIGRAHV